MASPGDPGPEGTGTEGPNEVNERRGFRVWRQVWKTGVSAFMKSDGPEK